MSNKQFTPAELEVMTVLWEHGELKPGQIQERFPREIKNPALRSILGILCEKGHVERRLEGKAYFYSARTRRQRAFKERLNELLENYCNGSMRSLLLHLSEADKLSQDDVETLKRIAEKMPEETEKEEDRS
ncbi:BlaI/MecI/CopY family transcriptional regulator [Cerasicoccus frondis]|uniref:BlaI/MecI/CopY family transcriptional regulator n=1 Tax=Cerasicoccus frondis TaxID=490090 RepID=UPI0028528C12|nr:BlaI/MecI/CopY family transcriptional regulator [Cerasicoccus frondis]